MQKVNMVSNEDVIWAGVVTYHPDLIKLKNLVNTLEDQVSKIIVFNNGGCLDEEMSKLFQGSNFRIIGCGENIGIAKALNEICKLAAQNSATHVVTFDQDSSPSNDFVNGLHEFFVARCVANKNVAAVGPVFIDERGIKEVLPVFQTERWWVKKINPLNGEHTAICASLLITSGMLLSISAWKTIGEFREDFFIDHVDTEWCLRALNQGFELFVCPSVVMQHEISDESPKRLFGRLVLKYSPIRRYYAFRNTSVLILEQGTPRGMRIYFFTTLCYRFFINLLVDKNKIRSFVAMLTGVVHGVIGKMGKQ